jgi:predicted porin
LRLSGGDARRSAVVLSSAVALLCAGVSAPALAQSAGPNPTPTTSAQAAAGPPSAPQTRTILSTTAQSNQVAAGRIPPPPPLTWHGLTVYGTVDVGAAYMNHGAPLSTQYGPGLPFVLQKFSNRSTSTLVGNALSQSKIGIAIQEPLWGDFSFVGRVETGINPTSGRIFDGPGSLIKNNGRALTQDVEAGDSSRAGQFDQAQGYFGISSKTFGTLTYGRQQSLILDNLFVYDPQAQSNAFSLIGYSGNTGGGGDTEDARLDNTIKYTVGYGPAHLGLMHQFRDSSYGAIPGGADEANVGAVFGGLSVDAVFAQVHDAVAAASLSAAQNAVAPNTLAATISDNTTYALMAKYTRGRFRLYGGWEHITYANPSNPVADGAIDEGGGGYTLSFVTNDAFDHHKELQVAWFGAKYYVTDRLSLTGAWYHYDQASYGTNCTNASAATCSGTEDMESAVADYRLSPRWDTYAGIESSQVANGLAYGYLQTSEFSPVAGIRFSF